MLGDKIQLNRIVWLKTWKMRGSGGSGGRAVLNPSGPTES